MLSKKAMNRGAGLKKSEPLTIKISEADKKLLAEICKREDRPLGYVARELMLRGLAAYNEDFELKPKTAPQIPGRVPLLTRTKPVSSKKKPA